MQVGSEAPVWVIASLRSVRLDEERTLATRENFPKNRDLKFDTETQTELALAVSNPQLPKSFSVKLSYKVNLRRGDDYEKIALEHSSLTICTFEIVSSSEGINWLEPDQRAFVPYFSFAHHFARQQAQRAIEATGLRGPSLPVPPEITGKGQLLEQNVPAGA